MDGSPRLSLECAADQVRALTHAHPNLAMTGGLPAPVQRWLERCPDASGPPGTAVIEGGGEVVRKGGGAAVGTMKGLFKGLGKLPGFRRGKKVEEDREPSPVPPQ